MAVTIEGYASDHTKTDCHRPLHLSEKLPNGIIGFASAGARAEEDMKHDGTPDVSSPTDAQAAMRLANERRR